MLIQIYVLVAVFAVLFSLASFLVYPFGDVLDLKGYLQIKVVLPWLATLLFFILSISSAAIHFEHCETVVDSINISNTSTGELHNYTSSYDCKLSSVEQVPSISLWRGAAIIMFLFSVANTIQTLVVMGGDMDDVI